MIWFEICMGSSYIQYVLYILTINLPRQIILFSIRLFPLANSYHPPFHNPKKSLAPSLNLRCVDIPHPSTTPCFAQSNYDLKKPIGKFM